MSLRIDLNADLGEGFGAWTMGADEGLLEHVTSANVACGFHAGDPRVIDRTVALAARAGVAIGAHPSHFDLRGFGRREIQSAPAEVEADVLYQVGALQAFASAHGALLRHVKPHGALYNQAVDDAELAAAIARGASRASRGIVFVGLAGSQAMLSAAEASGLRYAPEAFVDRAYDSAGRLVSRSRPGAVVSDPQAAAAAAVRLARERVVRTIDGGELAVEAATLCLHGDNPNALAVARAVREALERAGVSVRPLAP
jgi:5-oxoprolinase (ATP-hydrolysing) subunit A